MRLSEEFRVMWRYYVTSFLIGLSTLTGAYMFLFFRNELGMSFKAINLALLIFLVVDIIVEMPTGTYGDLASRKKQAIVGTIIMVFACLGLYFSYNALEVIVSYAVMGIGWAFFFGAREAWVVDQLKSLGKSDMLSLYYARSRIFFSIGSIVGPISASFIVHYSGMRILWLIDALITALTIVTISMDPEEKKEKNEQGFIAKIKKSFSVINHDTKLKLVMVLYFLAGLSLGSIAGQQPYLLLLGMPLIVFGFRDALRSLLSIAGLSSHSWIKKYGKTPIIIGYIMSFIITLWLLWIKSGMWVAAMIILLLPAILEFAVPILFEYQNKLTPSDVRSSVISMTGLYTSVGTVIGYIVGGLLLDGIGPMITIVLFSVIYAAQGITFSLLLPKSL